MVANALGVYEFQRKKRTMDRKKAHIYTRIYVFVTVGKHTEYPIGLRHTFF